MEIWPNFVVREQTHLIGPMAKGFAGQIGGNAVKNDVSTSRTRHYVTITSIERHTGNFLLMVLTREKNINEDI